MSGSFGKRFKIPIGELMNDTYEQIKLKRLSLRYAIDVHKAMRRQA
jgi:hypothetical protein